MVVWCRSRLCIGSFALKRYGKDALDLCNYSPNAFNLVTYLDFDFGVQRQENVNS